MHCIKSVVVSLTLLNSDMVSISPDDVIPDLDKLWPADQILPFALIILALQTIYLSYGLI